MKKIDLFFWCTLAFGLGWSTGMAFGINIGTPSEDCQGRALDNYSHCVVNTGSDDGSKGCRHVYELRVEQCEGAAQ